MTLDACGSPSTAGRSLRTRVKERIAISPAALHRHAGRRLVWLAILAGSTMSACGRDIWLDRQSDKGAVSVSASRDSSEPVRDSAVTMPGRSFAAESAGVEGKAKTRSAVITTPTRQISRDWKSPIPTSEQDPATSESGGQRASVVQQSDEPSDLRLAEPGIPPKLTPAPIRPAVDAGEDMAAWLLMAGCILLGAFLFWQRRRKRGKRRRREAWTPILWAAPS